ncbi:helix-turn-helix domain-containing protein [uncultured Limosilactobacillus sp.]|uniref:helix-turn-helix domain-containing protein n=1 Tax=uncultured Limosilactobacillus sp. TaxID=2837629 RepID=UPI0025EA379B|nr:helix-turn-helix transcriptional regulator [uncultured Limosilactobacillus sp.]
MNRIREQRKKAGLTLKQLSEELKPDFSITPDAIAKYERSERSPNDETWEKLANYFKVPVSYLKGYGYTKEYIVNCLRDGYRNNFKTKDFPTPISEDYGERSLVDDIKEYLNVIIHRIDISDVDMSTIGNESVQTWMTVLEPLFLSSSLERLLTTTDDLTDDEILIEVMNALEYFSFMVFSHLGSDQSNKVITIKNGQYIYNSKQRENTKKIVDLYLERSDLQEFEIEPLTSLISTVNQIKLNDDVENEKRLNSIIGTLDKVSSGQVKATKELKNDLKLEFSVLIENLADSSKD